MLAVSIERMGVLGSLRGARVTALIWKIAVRFDGSCFKVSP
jgi:hypothetical protein